MNNKAISLAALLVCGFCTLAAGQESSSTAAMPFLAVNPDPVASGMGGTASRGAFSHFSGIAGTEGEDADVQVGVAYNYFQPDAYTSHIAAAAGVWKYSDRLAFTAGVLYRAGEKFNVTSESGYSMGTFMPFDIRAGIGASYKIMDGLSAGLTLNYAQSNSVPEIDGEQQVDRTGFADVQVAYRFSFPLRLAVSATSLGLPVKSSSGDKYALPMALRADADYYIALGDCSLRPSLSVGMYFKGASISASLGLEYAYKDYVYVRTGGHLSSGETGMPSYFSLGAGVKLVKCLTLNAAWLYADGPMKNTVSAGLSLAL